MEKDNKISRETFLGRSMLAGASLVGSPLLSGFSTKNQSTESQDLKLAHFTIDVTPPIGSRLVYETERRIDQRLSCRGVVLLTQNLPIVLVSVDWIGIGNGGHDRWRIKLAQAAGTTPDRVAVHVLHQHDSLGFDTTGEYIQLTNGQHYEGYASPFHYKILAQVAEALEKAMQNPIRVTHIGVGSAKVKEFASNRRILLKNGKILARMSNTKGRPKLRKYPAGLIDPKVRLVSFWNDEMPIAVFSYYATHPQSYYLQGGASCDTVGIARNQRETDTGVFHIHFNGAGGNVAAGKYNDGSHKMRQILANRLATGMKKAFDATTKTPVKQDQIEWSIYTAALPPAIRPGKEVGAGEMLWAEKDELRMIEWYNKEQGMGRARDLAWLHRCIRRHKIFLSCLRLGGVAITHMPGELFVEYQLAAEKMRPDLFVAMAAYGDYGPGYIGTEAAYSNGDGYELGPPSRVSPEVENVLTRGLRKLLKAKNLKITPSYFTRQKKRYKKI